MSDITPIPGTSRAIIYRKENGLNALGLTSNTTTGTNALAHTGAADAQVGPVMPPHINPTTIPTMIPPGLNGDVVQHDAIDVRLPTDPVGDQNQPLPGALAMIGKAATLVIKIPFLLVAAPIVVCCNCIFDKPFG